MTDREWAACLFSQQIWFWGQDIARPEGNWLLKNGFCRTPVPADRDDCSSLYTLKIGSRRRIVLRGFGVFVGDDDIGGLFIERFDFNPLCTGAPVLLRPPWSIDDMQNIPLPPAATHPGFERLLLELIDWIRGYEARTLQELGINYRCQTLEAWDDGKRCVISVDEVDAAWLRLSKMIAADPDRWLSNITPRSK